MVNTVLVVWLHILGPYCCLLRCCDFLKTPHFALSPHALRMIEFGLYWSVMTGSLLQQQKSFSPTIQLPNGVSQNFTCCTFPACTTFDWVWFILVCNDGLFTSGSKRTFHLQFSFQMEWFSQNFTRRTFIACATYDVRLWSVSNEGYFISWASVLRT